MLEEDEGARRFLEEAAEAVRAIRAGEVDAVLVDPERVYTLASADMPYRLLVEGLSEAAVTLSPDGVVLSCNRHFEDLLRQGSHALLGRPLGTFVTEESQVRLERMIEGGLAGAAEENLVLLRSDGALIPLSLRATAVSEGVLGPCLLVTDRSEQRYFLELKETQRALREADRKKDEFLATLAHELRNPLAPIRNALEILKRPGIGEQDLQWARGVIDRQLQHMGRLLEDLLDVSRIGRKQLELRREPVDLASVLQAALETSRPVIETMGHELTVELPPEPIAVEADTVRLAQVFSNLLNNAANYTEPNGHLRLRVERAENKVTVCVQDDGIGIAAADLPHIFTIFSQSQPASLRSKSGMGIGLSLAKGLVELHDGTIAARSDGPGRGSEFLVCLPVLMEAPSAEDGGAAELAPELTVSRRVLVVDDHPDNADSLSVLLQLMGHEVSTAYDGEEALALAESIRPEVVLIDIAMPKLSGHDVGRRIREREWGKGVLLIAVSGWGQARDRNTSREAGFDHHLVKPADPAVLRELLGSRRTGESAAR
jgi:PAS domain S-box-containing protein